MRQDCTYYLIIISNYLRQLGSCNYYVINNEMLGQHDRLRVR